MQLLLRSAESQRAAALEVHVPVAVQPLCAVVDADADAVLKVVSGLQSPDSTE
jgi:hypothetical protein